MSYTMSRIFVACSQCGDSSVWDPINYCLTPGAVYCGECEKRYCKKCAEDLEHCGQCDKSLSFEQKFCCGLQKCSSCKESVCWLRHWDTNRAVCRACVTQWTHCSWCKRQGIPNKPCTSWDMKYKTCQCCARVACSHCMGEFTDRDGRYHRDDTCSECVGFNVGVASMSLN
jgi:hypothetical protein